MDEQKTIASLGEFPLIEKFFSTLTSEDALPAAQGVGDDAALLSIPRTQQLLTTTDTLVEGVHFNSDMDPFLLGQKALRVNLSDLAAMGAKPHWYLLALSLPANTSEAWLEEFSRGLKVAGEQFSISLVGGDTTRSKGCISVTLTLFGLIGKERAILRSGAQEGDSIFVTGTIGDSTLGLAQRMGQLRISDPEALIFLKHRHQQPTPRVDAGIALVERAIARAAIDISDGLIADLSHICRASNLAAEIYGEKIPFSPAATTLLQESEQDLFPHLLTGGEDYELLFTAAKGSLTQIKEIAENLDLPITEIGVMKKGEPGVTLLRDGAIFPLKNKGWSHF
ncbi:thiamine-phosphate kinase [Magnetococcales bacterium HHB-1]